MWSSVFVFLFLGGLCYGKEPEASQDEKKDNPLAHGFGNDIDWAEWEKATEISSETNRPIFMLIHKTWCGACQSLKQRSAKDPKRPEFVELSKKFVMVNLEDDEEPQDPKYAPDGGYIPRLFFLDKQGDPLAIDNKAKYPRNPHFYPELAQIIDGMNRALAEFGTSEKKEEVKEAEKEEKEKEKESVGVEVEETKTEEKKGEKKAEKTKKDKKEEKQTDEKKGDKAEKKTKDNKEEKELDEKAEEEKPKATCPHAAGKKAAEEKAKKEKEEKAKKEKKEKTGKKETGSQDETKEKTDKKEKKDNKDKKSKKEKAKEEKDEL